MGFFNSITKLSKKYYSDLKKGVSVTYHVVNQGLGKLGEAGRWADDQLQKLSNHGIASKQIDELRNSDIYHLIPEAFGDAQDIYNSVLPDLGTAADNVFVDIGTGIEKVSKATDFQSALRALVGSGAKVTEDTIRLMRAYEHAEGTVSDFVANYSERVAQAAE